MIITTWIPRPIPQRTLKDIRTSPETPHLCWTSPVSIAPLYVVQQDEGTPAVWRIDNAGDAAALLKRPEEYPLYLPEQLTVYNTLKALPLYRIIVTVYHNAWAKISETEWVRSTNGNPFQPAGTIGPDGTDFYPTLYELEKHETQINPTTYPTP